MCVYLHRSVALDILNTAYIRLRKSYNESKSTEAVDDSLHSTSVVLSLDTAFNLTKTILLLLMDDEDEIREKCARFIDTKFSFEEHKVLKKVHPYFIQEEFLENLGSIFVQLSREEVLKIIAKLAIDNDEGQNGLDENVADFRVFDKSEVNIFSESYVVKRKCRQILKTSEAELGDVI